MNSYETTKLFLVVEIAQKGNVDIAAEGLFACGGTPPIKMLLQNWGIQRIMVDRK